MPEEMCLTPSRRKYLMRLAFLLSKGTFREYPRNELNHLRGVFSIY